jgi:hypothetical protein
MCTWQTRIPSRAPGAIFNNTKARLDLFVGRFRFPVEEVVQELHEISDAAVFSRNVETSTPPGANARVDWWRLHAGTLQLRSRLHEANVFWIDLVGHDELDTTLVAQNFKAARVGVVLGGRLLQEIRKAVAETDQDRWPGFVSDLHLVEGVRRIFLDVRPAVPCLVADLVHADVERRGGRKALRANTTNVLDKNSGI